jgi:hypothetical protein
MSGERVHRPAMDRTAPRRDFTAMFERNGSSTSPDNPADDRPFDQTGDPIGNGVRAAYEVIEGYMRQGQQAAQQYAKRSYAPFQTAPETSDLQARSLQLWTDLVANWFDLLGVLTESMVRPAAASKNGEGTSRQAPDGEAAQSQVRPVQLAYEVASAQPVRVYAEFHPGRETIHLATHGLRSLTSSGCINVAFETPQGDGPVVIKIRVPGGQEPGLYTGALLHAHSGTAVGNLTLQLDH